MADDFSDMVRERGDEVFSVRFVARVMGHYLDCGPKDGIWERTKGVRAVLWKGLGQAFKSLHGDERWLEVTLVPRVVDVKRRCVVQLPEDEDLEFDGRGIS